MSEQECSGYRCRGNIRYGFSDLIRQYPDMAKEYKNERKTYKQRMERESRRDIALKKSDPCAGHSAQGAGDPEQCRRGTGNKHYKKAQNGEKQQVRPHRFKAFFAFRCAFKPVPARVEQRDPFL